MRPHANLRHMREPIVPELDAETYLMWEARQVERFELHAGFVVAMAGGRIDNDRIALNLCFLFDRLFPAPCKSFGSQVKIKVGKATFYYADAGVLCDESIEGDATFIETPTIIAEVLSPVTSAYDRIEKREAYRRLPTLHAYLIVHSAFRRVEIDTRLGDAWRTTIFDEGDIPFGSGTCSLDQIYARTDLALRA